MNNAPEILEKISDIEQSIETIQDLMKWDNELPIDERKTIIAHLHHLVKQKNEIKLILTS